MVDRLRQSAVPRAQSGGGTGAAIFNSLECARWLTTKVYPATLFRRAKPTVAYYSMALTETEARLALASYRLGEALNALLR